MALSWIKCYLTDRNQSVCIGQHSSPVVPCSVGVQGSVLGLLLFAIYTSSIAAVAQSHGVQQQQYADDTGGQNVKKFWPKFRLQSYSDRRVFERRPSIGKQKQTCQGSMIGLPSHQTRGRWVPPNSENRYCNG